MKDEGIHYIDLVWKTLNNWYQRLAEFTPNLIVGVLVFLFFLFSSAYLSKVSVKLFNRLFPDKKDSVTSLVGVFRFLILLLGTFISLEIMGLSGFLWKFIGSLGVAGVIAGVALKDLVSSIFSGMLVGIDKSFKVGDYVTIGNNSGTVQEIGFLTTKLITDDGKKVYVPNQIIFSAPFYNVTAAPQRRIILEFEIPADEDIATAQKGILHVIQNLENADKMDNTEVILTSLKQGSFIIQAKFWMKIGANLNQVKSEALLAIKKQLDIDKIQLETPTNIMITENNSQHNPQD